MHSRILKFYGQGYGPGPVHIQVKFNNVLVFDGPVPTVDLFPKDLESIKQTLLFTCSAPLTAGNYPMEIFVCNGTLLLGEVYINHDLKINPRFTVYQQHECYDATGCGLSYKTAIDIFKELADPPLTQEEINIIRSSFSYPAPLDYFYKDSKSSAILKQHNLQWFIDAGPDIFVPVNCGLPHIEQSSKDARTNVLINKMLQPKNTIGTWAWTINSGSIITYDLVVSNSVVA